MKFIHHTLYLALLIVLLASCAGKTVQGAYEINGTLPSATLYQDEWMYLVPLTGGSKTNPVDSVQINNGTFRFTGQVDSVQIKILRVRYQLRLALQELLVVMEPGQIQVAIDSTSTAHGTPQNEALQQWKEAKDEHDHALSIMMRMEAAKPDSTNQAKLEALKKTHTQRFTDFNTAFVKEHKGSVVGQFVSSLTGIQP